VGGDRGAGSIEHVDHDIDDRAQSRSAQAVVPVARSDRTGDSRCRARRLADVLTGNGRTSGCRLVRVALESSARRSVRSTPLVEHTALPRSAVAILISSRLSERAHWPNDCLRYSSFGPDNEARPFRVALGRLLLTLANPSPPRTTAERALPGTSSTSFRLCGPQPSSGTGFGRRRFRCCDYSGRRPRFCRPCWRLRANSRSPRPET
jgi:hypothetical protein